MKKIKEFSIAFVAALLLWSLATSQNLSESSFIVDLNITNIPNDYLISRKSDIKLNIAVSGPKSLISKLNSFNFNALFKMPETVKPGEFSFRITPSDIHGPSGVDVKSVSPSDIRIFLDKAATKFVNIKPEIVGTPADGYNVTKVELFPSQVNIRGPEEVLAQISEIETETPFDVTGLDGPYRQRVGLLLDDKSLSFVDNEFTTVNINIEPVIITKRLDNISITTYPVDIKTKLIPETFTADFMGPKLLIDKIIQPGIIAVIDIRDFKEDSKYLLTPVFPELPPEIQVIDRNPKKITVKIINEVPKKEDVIKTENQHEEIKR